MQSDEGLTKSQLKLLCDLKKSRVQRKQARFIIEGRREVLRAVQNRMPIETIYHSPWVEKSFLEMVIGLAGRSVEVHSMGEKNFDRISFRENPDGILAISLRPPMEFPTDLKPDALVTVLESIEKPGNLGAIARTIDAVGGDLLILANPICDPWNHNAIRASQGSIFGLPMVCCSNCRALEFLSSNKFRLFATSPRAENPFWNRNYSGRTGLIFGNENRGLSDFWFQHCSETIAIPQRSTTADSLNVTVAASLCLFEVFRVRNLVT